VVPLMTEFRKTVKLVVQDQIEHWNRDNLAIGFLNQGAIGAAQLRGSDEGHLVSEAGQGKDNMAGGLVTESLVEVGPRKRTPKRVV